jgi:hypothetical protein
MATTTAKGYRVIRGASFRALLLVAFIAIGSGASKVSARLLLQEEEIDEGVLLSAREPQKAVDEVAAIEGTVNESVDEMDVKKKRLARRSRRSLLEEGAVPENAYFSEIGFLATAVDAPAPAPALAGEEMPPMKRRRALLQEYAAAPAEENAFFTEISEQIEEFFAGAAPAVSDVETVFDEIQEYEVVAPAPAPALMDEEPVMLPETVAETAEPAAIPEPLQRRRSLLNQGPDGPERIADFPRGEIETAQAPNSDGPLRKLLRKLLQEMPMGEDMIPDFSLPAEFPSTESGGMIPMMDAEAESPSFVAETTIAPAPAPAPAPEGEAPISLRKLLQEMPMMTGDFDNDGDENADFDRDGDGIDDGMMMMPMMEPIAEAPLSEAFAPSPEALAPSPENAGEAPFSLLEEIVIPTPQKRRLLKGSIDPTGIQDQIQMGRDALIDGENAAEAPISSAPTKRRRTLLQNEDGTMIDPAYAQAPSQTIIVPTFQVIEVTTETFFQELEVAEAPAPSAPAEDAL